MPGIFRFLIEKFSRKCSFRQFAAIYEKQQENVNKIVCCTEFKKKKKFKGQPPGSLLQYFLADLCAP